MLYRIKSMLLSAALVATVGVFAADIKLPKPQTAGGMPLQDALRLRRTDRSFKKQPLPMQTVSSLLWSAFGINRADGKRTAPTARNRQEITLYVCIPEGTFRYDPKDNTLFQVSKLRTGDAPLMLIYVVDLALQPVKLCHVDCGFIGQNVYLFCASNKLATVFRGYFPKRDYRSLLDLEGKKDILYVQAVGYPK